MYVTLDTIRVAQLSVKYTRDWLSQGETMPEGSTTYNSGDEVCILLTTRTRYECVQWVWKTIMHGDNAVY